MRVAILTHGTRGDVQPYAVIGHELMNRGMEVTVAVSENYVAMVESAGLAAVAIPIDSEAVLVDERGESYLANGRARDFLNRMAKEGRAKLDAVCAASLAACHGADVIVTSLLSVPQAILAGSVKGQRVVPVFVSPFEPTGEYPSPYFAPSARIPGRAFRRATHRLAEKAAWIGLRENAQVFARQVGHSQRLTNPYPMIRRQGIPTINLISRYLMPVPADWPGHVSNVGVPIVPPSLRSAWGEQEVPQALVDWLDAGPAPVFFGFGSLPLSEPTATIAMFREAARRLGRRALVAVRWGKTDGLEQKADEDVFVALQSLDHDQVMSRCAAAVHHGGAGTTHSACLAGLPAVVAYLSFDQGLWGRAVAERGIGSSVRFRTLTTEKLVEHLRPLLSPTVKQRAEWMGAEMRTERPVEAIVAVLDPSRGLREASDNHEPS